MNEYPAMRYGPNNTYAIFHSEDEVPEGWTDTLKKRKDFNPDAPLVKTTVAVEPAELIMAVEDLTPPLAPDEPVTEITDEAVKAIEDLYLNKEMVAILEVMQETNEDIEFAKNWSGAKLARCILENGGVPEALAKKEA